MKKYLYLTLCLLFISVVQAQDSTIKNLDIRIEAAALEEDYAKAALLTKEKEVRIALEKAVEEKDFEKAAELKEELSNLEQKKTSAPSIKTNSETKNTTVRPVKSIRNSNVINNGFFIDALIGISPRTLKKAGLGAVGLKLGNKWYFGRGPVYFPGLQIVWIKPVLLYNTNGGGILMEFTPMNFGFANGIAINDKLGLEANFGVGYTTLIGFSNFIQFHGVNFTPDVKLIYKKLAVGLEFSNSFYNGFSVNTFSLSIGGKF